MLFRKDCQKCSEISFTVLLKIFVILRFIISYDFYMNHARNIEKRFIP